MTLPAASDDFETALHRLDQALCNLESVAERILEADEAGSEADEAFAVMEDDRSRLALELDSALTHNRKLASANDEVAQRLEKLGAGFAACLVPQESE